MIWKIPKIPNLESKLIFHVSIIDNLENDQIFEIL